MPQTPDGGPYCGTCRGARWSKRADFDPTRLSAKDNGLVRCPDCKDSQRAARLNRLATIAGLSDEQRRQTFASLKPVRGMAQAVKVASKWAAEPDGWIVLHGVPGSGKTHLALAVANALIAREKSIIWRYVPRLIFDLRQQAGANVPDGITSMLIDAPILFLDDLGAARWTDYATEAMELVSDSRYGRRLPTFVTLIGDKKRHADPAYDVAEDVRRTLSDSIGRRMQDKAICQIVRNPAPQYSDQKPDTGNDRQQKMEEEIPF